MIAHCATVSRGVHWLKSAVDMNLRFIGVSSVTLVKAAEHKHVTLFKNFVVLPIIT